VQAEFVVFYSFDGEMACLQVSDFAMTPELIEIAKERCHSESDDFAVSPIITLPLSKSFGLFITGKKKQQATSSKALSHTNG